MDGHGAHHLTICIILALFSRQYTAAEDVQSGILSKSSCGVYIGCNYAEVTRPRCGNGTVQYRKDQQYLVEFRWIGCDGRRMDDILVYWRDITSSSTENELRSCRNVLSCPIPSDVVRKKIGDNLGLEIWATIPNIHKLVRLGVTLNITGDTGKTGNKNSPNATENPINIKDNYNAVTSEGVTKLVTQELHESRPKSNTRNTTKTVVLEHSVDNKKDKDSDKNKRKKDLPSAERKLNEAQKQQRHDINSKESGGSQNKGKDGKLRAKQNEVFDWDGLPGVDAGEINIREKGTFSQKQKVLDGKQNDEMVADGQVILGSLDKISQTNYTLTHTNTSSRNSSKLYSSEKSKHASLKTEKFSKVSADANRLTPFSSTLHRMEHGKEKKTGSSIVKVTIAKIPSGVNSLPPKWMKSDNQSDRRKMNLKQETTIIQIKSNMGDKHNTATGKDSKSYFNNEQYFGGSNKKIEATGSSKKTDVLLKRCIRFLCGKHTRRCSRHTILQCLQISSGRTRQVLLGDIRKDVHTLIDMFNVSQSDIKEIEKAAKASSLALASHGDNSKFLSQKIGQATADIIKMLYNTSYMASKAAMKDTRSRPDPKISDSSRLGEWSNWATCSASCGQGKSIRMRNCVTDNSNSKNSSCDSKQMIEVRLCHSSPCYNRKTDVLWSQWSSWSTCSVSCGLGEETRKRICDNKTKKQLQSPSQKTKSCKGKDTLVRQCIMTTCYQDSNTWTKSVLLGYDTVLHCGQDQEEPAIESYWITPRGQKVSKSSQMPRFYVVDNALVIHGAQRTDTGLYHCVFVKYAPSGERRTITTDTRIEILTCLSSPCKNGGICQERTHSLNAKSSKISCTCLDGFQGKQCQNRILRSHVRLYLLISLLTGLLVSIIIGVIVYCCVYRKPRKDANIKPGTPLDTSKQSKAKLLEPIEEESADISIDLDQSIIHSDDSWVEITEKDFKDFQGQNLFNYHKGIIKDVASQPALSFSSPLRTERRTRSNLETQRDYLDTSHSTQKQSHDSANVFEMPTSPGVKTKVLLIQPNSKGKSKSKLTKSNPEIRMKKSVSFQQGEPVQTGSRYSKPVSNVRLPSLNESDYVDMSGKSPQKEGLVIITSDSILGLPDDKIKKNISDIDIVHRKTYCKKEKEIAELDHNNMYEDMKYTPVYYSYDNKTGLPADNTYTNISEFVHRNTYDTTHEVDPEQIYDINLPENRAVITSKYEDAERTPLPDPTYENVSLSDGLHIPHRSDRDSEEHGETNEQDMNASNHSCDELSDDTRSAVMLSKGSSVGSPSNEGSATHQEQIHDDNSFDDDESFESDESDTLHHEFRSEDSLMAETNWCDDTLKEDVISDSTEKPCDLTVDKEILHNGKEQLGSNEYELNENDDWHDSKTFYSTIEENRKEPELDNTGSQETGLRLSLENLLDDVGHALQLGNLENENTLRKNSSSLSMNNSQPICFEKEEDKSIEHVSKESDVYTEQTSLPNPHTDDSPNSVSSLSPRSRMCKGHYELIYGPVGYPSPSFPDQLSSESSESTAN